MSRPHPRAATALATTLALAAGPAAALTAPELWEDWIETSARLGLVVDAESEDYSDGTLRLTGLTLTQAAETLGMSTDSVTRFAEVSLVEDGDAVRIEVPASVEVTSTSTVDGETTTATGRYETEGLDYVARDVDGARVYELEAALVAYVIDDVTDGRSEVAPVPLRVEMRDVASEATVAQDGGYEQSLTAASFAVNVDSSAEPGGAVIDYALDAVSGEMTGRIPEAAAEPGSVSPIGLMGTFDLSLAHQGSRSSFDGQAPQGRIVLRSRSDEGGATMALDEAGLEVEARDAGGETTLELPMLASPVDLTTEETRVGLTVPLAVGAAEPYALDIALRELVINDATWDLFDPTGQLDRTPATLVVSLAGEAEVLVDLRGDVEAAMAFEGAPVRPETLNLTEVLLRVAGAELTASGALTFPEGGPVPQPVGTIDLALTGGMALLDGLVALGVVAPQQAAGARAMAGVFGRPVGEDRLESTIAFGEDGSITANGLQLR